LHSFPDSLSTTLAGAATLLSESFEAPMVTGPLQGQNGWFGDNGGPNVVNTTHAHGGAQSVTTVVLAAKLIPAPFQVMAEPFWYLETWVYLDVLPSGQSYTANLSAFGPLGTSFFIDLSVGGELTMNTSTKQAIRQLGTAVLGKWLRMRIEKIAPLTLKFTLFGDGVDETYIDSFASSWDPIYVGIGGGTVNGGPFFDDVHLATDNVTATRSATWGRLKALYK
jgi:hypothetical protein